MCRSFCSSAEFITHDSKRASLPGCVGFGSVFGFSAMLASQLESARSLGEFSLEAGVAREPRELARGGDACQQCSLLSEPPVGRWVGHLPPNQPPKGRKGDLLTGGGWLQEGTDSAEKHQVLVMWGTLSSWISGGRRSLGELTG